MEKKHFLLKLIPCRPTFAQDMSEEEKIIMKQHVTYLTELMNKGIVLVFGPVLDPQGAYGLGIIEVDNEESAAILVANDPASKINKYEIYPMLAKTPQKQDVS